MVINENNNEMTFVKVNHAWNWRKDFYHVNIFHNHIVSPDEKNLLEAELKDKNYVIILDDG